MSMLEFPTFEEMVAVMNSPDHPPEPMDHADMLSSDEMEMEMSADDMLREIYDMMREMHGKHNDGVQIGNGGKATAPNANAVYDSTTSNYDGGVVSMLYNGGANP